MAVFTEQANIAASPERTWAVLADLDQWPAWTPTVSRVERLDGGPPTVGSRVRIEQPKLQPAVWEITTWQPARGFTWVARHPGLVITAEHLLRPRGSDTELLLRLAYDGPLGWLVGLLAGRITRDYLGREARGLKARAESGA